MSTIVRSRKYQVIAAMFLVICGISFFLKSDTASGADTVIFQGDSSICKNIYKFLIDKKFNPIITEDGTLVAFPYKGYHAYITHYDTQQRLELFFARETKKNVKAMTFVIAKDLFHRMTKIGFLKKEDEGSMVRINTALMTGAGILPEQIILTIDALSKDLQTLKKIDERFNIFDWNM